MSTVTNIKKKALLQKAMACVGQSNDPALEEANGLEVITMPKNPDDTAVVAVLDKDRNQLGTVEITTTSSEYKPRATQ